VNDKRLENFKLKVLFVEDDKFTLRTIAELLEHLDLEVVTARSVPEAVRILTQFEPNAVITDLDLGPGPDGTDLLRHITENYPWIGKIILSAHSSAVLAVSTTHELPADTTYLIKSFVSGKDIYGAVLDSVERANSAQQPGQDNHDEIFILSKSQAEILRMLSDGLSNSAIARLRSRSLPATESLIHRLFTSLGLDSNPDSNQRVLAVKMWQQGRVQIK